MVRKLVKSGDNLAVALPAEIFEGLQLHEGSEVNIEFDSVQKQIIITPPKPSFADIDAIFAKQVAEFIETYRPALEALAR